MLLIGRLMPFKGIVETVDYFKRSQYLKAWELHIAGDGPLREYVLHASNEHNIFYHGYVIDKKKEELFEECDVLVFLTSELETIWIGDGRGFSARHADYL